MRKIKTLGRDKHSELEQFKQYYQKGFDNLCIAIEKEMHRRRIKKPLATIRTSLKVAEDSDSVNQQLRS